MKNSLLNRFIPKEVKFFPLLQDLSLCLLEASELLVESLEYETSENRIEYYKRIKEVERRGDRLTNLIFHELGKTFITPFDREDIHDLASSIDDVIDRINSSSKRIAIYNPNTISDSGKTLALLIQETASLIHRAINLLDTFSKNQALLRQFCTGLHDIENEADDVYETFITKLFQEEKDSIEIIKIKEVMQELERATDAADRVGKILKILIVKYA